ncbi:MAG: nucleotidyl transferase AbiEii/AbiGii toxin family protein [Acidimicrobiia bacterium]|nr:nucleotidyl transferase AbiEii/AbiGii toxin family protein [Acidimicrobiia bacterium]
MSYDTPKALRMALEQRLLSRSEATGISLDRLRRRVLFERIVARLQAAEPGLWVIKGGMALEVRLRDDARLTKDLDLGLRAEVHDGVALEERLIEALSVDADGDRFVLSVGSVKRLMEDGDGQATWRAQIAATLADKPFGGIQVDVSPRAHELDATDLVPLPNSLEFAGIATPVVEVVDLQRHIAEKFHGMLKVFDDRVNSRVRDLVDLVILSEHGLIDAAVAATAVRAVWTERGSTPPPVLPPLPTTWPDRYERLATEHGLDAATFPDAVAVVATLWSQMFATKET